MERKLSIPHTVQLSECTLDGRLSVPAVFELFMDIATVHAETLEIGLKELSPRSLFWLTVRTRIKLYRRPALLEAVTVETWPEKAGKLRCNRDYRLQDAQGVAAEGKTEWAVINTSTGRLTPMTEVYHPALTALLNDETVWSEPFGRLGEKFAPEERWGEYTVRSTDIDLGGHMNNAAYPRMLLGAFANAELRETPLRELELSFRTPCYEGDELTLYRRKKDTGWDVAAFTPQGKPAVLGRIN